MSRSTGCVKTPEGLQWFVVMNSTDVGVSHLYEDKKEMLEDWQRGSIRLARPCRHPLVPIQFYTDYGGGYYREGEMCGQCKTITYSDETAYPPEEDFANSIEEWPVPPVETP